MRRLLAVVLLSVLFCAASSNAWAFGCYHPTEPFEAYIWNLGFFKWFPTFGGVVAFLVKLIVYQGRMANSVDKKILLMNAGVTCSLILAAGFFLDADRPLRTPTIFSLFNYETYTTAWSGYAFSIFALIFCFSSLCAFEWHMFRGLKAEKKLSRYEKFSTVFANFFYAVVVVSAIDMSGKVYDC